jgi:dolichol-phosphate mannosyltransferase
MALSPKLQQRLRFVSAGVPGVLLFYITLYTLTEVVGLWYIGSAVIAAVINYTSNFLLQKFWTFKNKTTHNVRQQASKYLGLAITLHILNLLLLYSLVEYIHLWYLAAQAIVSAVLTVISYFASRRIFSNNPQPPR